jgi:hypothetical protein
LTESRPERPELATVICILEVAAAVLAIAAHFVRLYLHNLHGYHRASLPSTYNHPLQSFNDTTLHYAAMGLTCTLALAIAVTLWQMRRSAFYLSATRTALSLASVVAVLLSPSRGMHSGQITGFVTLILNAAITGYVYRITLPKAEAAPIVENKTPIEDLNENQSVSQFYISHIHDRKDQN